MYTYRIKIIKLYLYKYSFKVFKTYFGAASHPIHIIDAIVHQKDSPIFISLRNYILYQMFLKSSKRPVKNPKNGSQELSFLDGAGARAGRRNL